MTGTPRDTTAGLESTTIIRLREPRESFGVRPGTIDWIADVRPDPVGVRELQHQQVNSNATTTPNVLTTQDNFEFTRAPT